MTSKKKRQRGTRTRGGGSHKHNRGAGHSGGRGAAGRDKHEYHNHPPLGKHGFSPPEKTQDAVAEVTVQELDEDAALLVAEGLAEEEDGAFHVDARDVAEDGYAVDVVKVLGNGEARQELHVTADAFTAGARAEVEQAGGSVALTERAEEAETDDDTDEE